MNKKLFNFLSVSVLLSNIMFPAMANAAKGNAKKISNLVFGRLLQCYCRRRFGKGYDRKFRIMKEAINYCIDREPSCEVTSLQKEEKFQSLANYLKYIKEFVSKNKYEINKLNNPRYNKLLDKINNDEYLEMPPTSPKHRERAKKFNLNIIGRDLSSDFNLVAKQQDNPYITISDDDEQTLEEAVE